MDGSPDFSNSCGNNAASGADFGSRNVQAFAQIWSMTYFTAVTRSQDRDGDFNITHNRDESFFPV